jgi:exopolyphosphatase/guanosine-5'-triphosphate,3'-diphosphate pyrophosphatase
VTESRAPVGALDIGSNTVRMLVAQPGGDPLETLLDLGTYASLGEGVDRTGELREENQQRALDAITDFVGQARAAGAEPIAAVATSAIRDARNGPDFAARVKDATGIEPQIISGDREAELTAIGATLGGKLDVETVVVDLGGGSGEVILMREAALQWGKALPIGSRRLTERFIRTDPPTADELAAVDEHVRSLLRELPGVSPQRGIFAGGTANALPQLLGHPGPPAILSSGDLARLLTIVQGLTGARLAEEFRLPPQRAQVLAAGAATLAAIARFYGLDEVSVPGTGIREGMIIDVLRKQGRWP